MLCPVLHLPDRILDKLYFCPASGCWFWGAGWDSGDGYGKVWWGSREYMAHRAIYEALVGPIPTGLVLDHICRTRICCNPGHLEPVTVQVNTARGGACLFYRRCA